MTAQLHKQSLVRTGKIAIHQNPDQAEEIGLTDTHSTETSFQRYKAGEKKVWHTISNTEKSTDTEALHLEITAIYYQGSKQTLHGVKGIEKNVLSNC